MRVDMVSNGLRYGPVPLSRPGLGLGLTLLALAPTALSAGTTSGTMAVSVTVEESCRLDTHPLNFGALPSGQTRIDAQSTVVISCTPNAGYEVTMDEGRHGAGGARRLADAAGTRFIAYDIYRDAARTRRWGGTPVSAVSSIALPSGRAELGVHARLTAAEAVPGTYGDTVTVTVAF